MKPTEMNDALFKEEMEKLLAQVQFWAMRLEAIQPGFCLEPVPVSYLDGSGKQPFPLALELKRVWDYARGEGPRPAELKEIIQELVELLWCPVAGHNYIIPYEWWNTPLGQMCRMAEARATIDDGGSLSAQELSYLSGIAGQWIREMCATGKLMAEKVTREQNSQTEWAIPAEECRRFLAERGLMKREAPSVRKG